MVIYVVQGQRDINTTRGCDLVNSLSTKNCIDNVACISSNENLQDIVNKCCTGWDKEDSWNTCKSVIILSSLH